MSALTAKLKLRLSGETDASAFSLDYLGLTIDGNDIPVGFNSFSAYKSEEEGVTYLEVETGKGLWKDYDLDDCYDEVYTALGLSREGFTAEFLSKAIKVYELGVYSDVTVLELMSLSFTDYDTDVTFECKGDLKACAIHNAYADENGVEQDKGVEN